jgi:hypothetical protein
MNSSNGIRHTWVKGGKRSNVAGKEMCCCRLVLRLQEGNNVDQP